jgi:c-di-GMP-binding flagellar brake protein YcgR
MDMKYERQERRAHKRLKVNFIVTYDVSSPFKIRMLVGNKEVYANMFDLSEGGMGILTSYDIPPATIILLRFILINLYAYQTKNRSILLNTRGKVVYNILLDKKEHRIGIHFIDIDEQDRYAIADFVKLQSLYNTQPSSNIRKLKGRI